MGRPTLDGVLVVMKPVGPSSHDVVAVARRALGTRRVGHTGTLDPQASGVLPLVLGQATRLSRYLTGADKEYEAEVRFGVVSDTFDRSGQLRETGAPSPTSGDITEALARFRGTFAQTPPVYSAKMVGGKRSYELARTGRSVASPPVLVTTYELELLAYDAPLARLRVKCSSGFYVRSLAHDLGQAVGAGAMLAALVRTAAGEFPLTTAIGLDALATRPRDELCRLVTPMEAVMNDLAAVRLTTEGVEWVRHGREIGPRQLIAPLPVLSDPTRLIGPDERLVGLARPSPIAGFLRPTVVFR